MQWAFIEFEYDYELEALLDGGCDMEDEHITFYGNGMAQFIGTSDPFCAQLTTEQFPVDEILLQLDRDIPISIE